MKVLFGCETSGHGRDAFAALGHDAWSCDISPSEREGQHIQADVLSILDDGWDLMIGHPPCTYLSYAAAHCWNHEGRAEKREAAKDFFLALYNAPIPHVAIENPVGWMNQVFRKPDQIIHPYYFGERQLKKTCLWLRGLSPLWYWKDNDLFGKKTIAEYPEPVFIDNVPRKKKRHFTDYGGGIQRRSRSFESIARAMASQWTFELDEI